MRRRSSATYERSRLPFIRAASTTLPNLERAADYVLAQTAGHGR